MEVVQGEQKRKEKEKKEDKKRKRMAKTNSGINMENKDNTCNLYK